MGKLLTLRDPGLRRCVIQLLEKSGTNAAPATSYIIVALRDTNTDVRYLATRSLEAIVEHASPEVRLQICKALSECLNDKDNKVCTVSRRTIAKHSPSMLSDPATNSPSVSAEIESKAPETGP